MVLGFQADVTRVMTFVLANEEVTGRTVYRSTRGPP